MNLDYIEKLRVDSGIEGIIDEGNYSMAFLNHKGVIIYANRIFLKNHFNSLHMKNINNVHLKYLHPELWLNINNSNSFPDKKLIKLFGNSKRVIGYLFLEKMKEIDNLSKKFNTLSPKDVFTKDIYHGLYLADEKGNTIKVNNSYEKISFLPEFEVKGKNLRELEEKGYFSKSVTLLVLEKIRKERIAKAVSIQQKIITGKEALVTGIPIFSSNGDVKYVMTIVKEIIPFQDLFDKLLFSTQNKVWYGFNDDKKEKDIIEFDGEFIVNRSMPMKNIVENLKKASATSMPILLQGETGVGKDILARYLHYYESKKYMRKLPFVMINCSAIPKELLETEMFGYEPGSFSGAGKYGKKGLIELANEGILFLNEIGDMPLELQAKFLSVIDNGVIRRVGGVRELAVKFQLVSATNKEMEKLIENNLFREDLYYRISGIKLEVPPIRERKEDIAPLILYFIKKKYRDRKIFKNKILSSAVLEELINYKWPGNVRELFHVIEELYVLSGDNIITLSDLPAKITQNRFNSQIFDNRPASLKEKVRQYEIEQIKKALIESGSATKAAKALKIDVSTLRRKLKN